jgi:hypothetical protein
MIKRTTRLNAQSRFQAMTTAVAAIMAMSHDPEFSGKKEEISRLNASSIVQGSFSEPLTTYATGWQDGGNIIQTELDFFAPSVQVGRRFEYLENINWEAFLAGSEEDLRAIGGDFKSVKYNSLKTLGKTENRGLQIMVDLDEVKDEPNWEKNRVAKLKRRLLANKLIRAIALYTAADVNTGKTWDVSAGKDPDMDVIAELVAASDISGMKPNRVGLGDIAWSKRALSHRAQNTAGGFASAGMTPEALAGFLGVDQVLHSNSRYSSTKTAKAQVLGQLVLMFIALQNADTEDPSNVKDFWTPTDQGVQFAVHSIPHGIKTHIIAVEHYEKLTLTSNLAIRSFTIS